MEHCINFTTFDDSIHNLPECIKHGSMFSRDFETYKVCTMENGEDLFMVHFLNTDGTIHSVLLSTTKQIGTILTVPGVE